MKRVLRVCGPGIALLVLACQDPQKPGTLEGVYTMCREVQGFSGETIELKAGKFRYWFYSDVRTTGEPEYPLSGSYRVEGNVLILEHEKIFRKKRTFAVVNGIDVLWRGDGLELWQKEKRIHPYAVLLRVAGATDGSKVVSRPSIESLESEELKKRDKQEFEERFNDQPAEVRLLLRAKSMKAEPHLDTYKKEIRALRDNPDPKVLAQLVGLLGRNSGLQVDGHMILEDIFGSTFLFKGPPPFLKEKESRVKGLGDLIDSLSHARDRTALEEVLMVFLRASEIGKMSLTVPETVLTVILEAGPNGGGRYASQGTSADDIDWLKGMPKLVPACQSWMREHLKRQ